MGRWPAFRVLAVVAAAAAFAAGCGSDDDSSSTSSKSSSGSTAAKSSEPIVIGAAIDQSSFLSPYDTNALNAAKIEADKINAKGGVNGRKIEFKVKNTQLKPASTRAAALDLINAGADILWVSGDVDLATPSIQVGLSQKKLTVAPYISTDQMGPKRFGDAGKLAFTFGSIAQDEGAALAEFAFKKGWKTAQVVTDKTLTYTQNDGQAFQNRFKELGGKIVGNYTFTQGDHTIAAVARKVAAKKAQVTFISTIFTPAGDLSAFVSAIRSAGDTTPILGPQGLDGNWFSSKKPKIFTNVWHTNYASVGGDDPDPKVNTLRDEMAAKGNAPQTAQFVLGATGINVIVQAVKEAGGSTDGDKLASIIQNYKNVPTVSGPVTYTPDIHGVTGRPWRVMQIDAGKRSFSETIKASSPADL